MAEEDKDKLVFKHVFTAENPGVIDDFYKFDRKKPVGEGSYGNVYVADNKVTGQKRAIKAIDISKIKGEERFKQEISIQQQLDHPHIVKLYETFMDAKKIYLVMELCTGGELFDRIVEEAEKRGAEGSEGQAFDERGAASYMQQILGAMRYLHEKGYAHRDIKPENFLLQSKAVDAPIKVIDFGLAKAFSSLKPGTKMTTKAGTPYYVSPQVLAGSYTEKADIWSCGVIAYILLCGYPPFFGDADPDILRRVKRGTFDFPSPDWDDISKPGKDIIKQMLTMDEASRPSAEKLLEHSWLVNHADKPQGAVPKNLGSNLKNFTGASKLKKVVLTLIAQQLNESEIEDLKNTFSLLDVNKDGTLTVAEIKDALMKQGDHIDVHALEVVLKQLDTDDSGSIDYTEFIAASLEKSKYLEKEVLWTAFRTFDKDGDGVITKAELAQVMGMHGESGNTRIEKLLASMIKEADLDGDGVISFEEFTAMMSKASPSVAL